MSAIDNIEESIRTFICTELDYKPDEIADETLLFTTGMVDSFTFVSLVAFLEQSLGIRIAPESVTVENFDSISRIVGFLRRVQA